jgi:hypothetical protein
MVGREVFARACRAWARRCEREALVYEQPSRSLSDVDFTRGRVVLRNVRGTLALYRWTGRRLVLLTIPPDEGEDAPLTVDPRYAASGPLTIKYTVAVPEPPHRR